MKNTKDANPIIWEPFYKDVPKHIEYFKGSLYAFLKPQLENRAQSTALYFEGKSTSFKQLDRQIDLCAKSFLALGIKPGQRVMLCMPNVPQTVYCFYALNKIGAVAVFMHPLSSPKEIYDNLLLSKCVFAVTLDQFYSKFLKGGAIHLLNKLIISSVSDALDVVKSTLYKVIHRQEHVREPVKNVVSWKNFLLSGNRILELVQYEGKGEDAAVILFSGGTTGVNKGIVLTNLNFNALSVQTFKMGHDILMGQKILALLPMFHGFGLGVCIHCSLTNGCQSILMPRFSVKGMQRVLTKVRPHVLAGVPTLYENLITNKAFKKVKLNYLSGVFCGGDSLSPELMKRVNEFLQEKGSNVQIREGYGTTECVTVSSLNPYFHSRAGSIGIPFPDTLYKIVRIGTTEQVQNGEDGEICIFGPTVMKEYLDCPNETADTLKQHDDGNVWLHTGDIGCMSDDGFIYFKQRIKRVIISSGYNLYPSQIEAALERCPLVSRSCVIGVLDPLKGQRTKAFVVLKEAITLQHEEQTRQAIIEHLKNNVAKFSMVYDIEFLENLPMTKINKIDYRALERQASEKTV